VQSTVVKNELVVGSFLAVAVLLGALWATNQSREKGLLDTQKVSFTVPNGSGLQKGAPVVMRGVEVGSIGDVVLTEDHKVLVTAEIRPRFAPFVSTDALASVVEPPFLGTTKVELEPGTGAKVGVNETLKTKTQRSFLDRLEEIEVDARKTLKKVESAVDEAKSTLEEIKAVAKSAREGKGLIAQLLNDEQLATDVKTILADVREITKQIREGEGAAALAINDPDFAKDLKATVKDLREVADTIQKGEGTLGKLVKDSELFDESTSLVKDVRGTLAKLNELNEQAKTSMAKVEQLLDSTNGAVKKIEGLVGSAGDVTKELALTVKKINSGEGTVAALLNDDAVYRETKSLLKELRESVEDLREQAPINSFIGVVFSAF
jgi:phospholipid/cholesterol/gamma-HCH transport system substrate-binding protein